MASDQSETSGGSRVRQFGLYRSIDSRTEEFLKLARRRQMRQGCACAVISTAITVTIIVAVLLIYEYAIAVETSLVHKKKNHKNRFETYVSPIADRLDRSYFGFDQDYYERMPLLVNAMAENVADETLSETITTKDMKSVVQQPAYKTHRPVNLYSLVRRTSPRPFQFEHKSPTPFPFRKTYGSRSWVESYRNAQRMQNLQQIMVYLGKAFNAKLADMNTIPSNTHIAFSGLYIEPPNSESATVKLSPKSRTVESRHRNDPLFTFKPDSPNDVNLLAEDLLNFSPTFIHNMQKSNRSYTQNIFDSNRNSAQSRHFFKNKKDFLDDKLNTDLMLLNKPDVFNLDMIPTEPTNVNIKNPTSSRVLRKIYITTSRPVIQFKPKLAIPIRRSNVRHKRPYQFPEKSPDNIPNETPIPDSNTSPKMIVHVNVFPTKTIIKTDDITTVSSSTTVTTTTKKPFVQIPIINLSAVQDYHAGSSGIIPVTTQPQVAPQATTTVPFFDPTVSLPEQIWPTDPPNIIKFSREDAKLPDLEYLTTQALDNQATTITETTTNVINKNFEYDDDNSDVEARTLIIKLVNNFQPTTQSNVDESNGTDTHQIASNTYVPQNNGHHRNVESARKILLDLLKESSEKYKRNRFKNLTTARTPTYIPLYVEIKRNRTRHHSDNNE